MSLEERTDKIVAHYEKRDRTQADVPRTHVEMYDGQTFCGMSCYERGHEWIHQRDWHDNSATIRDCTCEACLRKINTLGLCADVTLWERFRK